MRPDALVIQLTGALDPSSVGPKAANLARAIESGFRVPPGFIVTRRALSLVLDQTDLLGPVRTLLDPQGDRLQADRDEAYETVRRRLLDAPIPQPVIDAVAPLADALLAEASCGLAVRSSGVHEDSATSSFAGVYESFLGIRSLEGLWASIQQCWCSAWARHAVDYARKMGIEPEPDGMAVLVQSLLAADSAGVLLTADPLTGNPWRFVLESSFGLARDWVASTGATPVDRFLFEWDSGEILGRDIARKQTALVPGARGVESTDIPPDRQLVPSLTDDLATRIAQVGLWIDRAFGVRVDVEWVVGGEDIHIVQVRPITALPPFFPHHLPAHLADQTWLAAARTVPWYRITKEGRTVTLPIHRHKLIYESINRYLEVGPVETPANWKSGAELDFHGHRYLMKGDDVWPPWPRIPVLQQEQYLVECEPRMRAEFLHTSNSRFSVIEEKARRLESEVETLPQAIDAILWAHDEDWGVWAFFFGPAQHMMNPCRLLLDAFVAENLTGVDVNDLLQGHHPDLDPYWPHVMKADAEEMAKLLEPERKRFEGLSAEELVVMLEEQQAPAPFVAALDACCDHLGLVPPWQFHTLGEAPRERWAIRQTTDILRLVSSALRGSPPIARIVEETTRRREAAMVRAREILAASPVEVTRFERLHDWALFWGPALNHRVVRPDVPRRKLRRLLGRMRQVLLAAGLVDDVDDVAYFTVEDLKVIAATGDIAAGRRLLQRRKLEYERSDRLVAPPFLGKAPEEGLPTKVHAAPGADRAGTEPGSVIAGKPAGPGCSKGIIRRVQTLAEGDDVGGEEDVVVLLNPIESHNQDIVLLFSMMLRVRGLVVPHAPTMWTGHMSQIARECRVPVVRALPPDLDRLVEGCLVEVDGTRGILTLLDA